MKDKIYRRLLIAVTSAGLALTAVHIAYAAYAYRYSSIIYFITKELW